MVLKPLGAVYTLRGSQNPGYYTQCIEVLPLEVQYLEVQSVLPPLLSQRVLLGDVPHLECQETLRTGVREDSDATPCFAVSNSARPATKPFGLCHFSVAVAAGWWAGWCEDVFVKFGKVLSVIWQFNDREGG